MCDVFTKLGRCPRGTECFFPHVTPKLSPLEGIGFFLLSHRSHAARVTKFVVEGYSDQVTACTAHRAHDAARVDPSVCAVLLQPNCSAEALAARLAAVPNLATAVSRCFPVAHTTDSLEAATSWLRAALEKFDPSVDEPNTKAVDVAGEVPCVRFRAFAYPSSLEKVLLEALEAPVQTSGSRLVAALSGWSALASCVCVGGRYYVGLARPGSGFAWRPNNEAHPNYFAGALCRAQHKLEEVALRHKDIFAFRGDSAGQAVTEATFAAACAAAEGHERGRLVGPTSKDSAGQCASESAAEPVAVGPAVEPAAAFGPAQGLVALDLGASPGGWSLFLASPQGAGCGTVFAVDPALLELAALPPQGSTCSR